jgi:ubiquinone/menaquinone biosynthesis C-methylase UbiE
LTRVLARWPNVREVVGVDAAQSLLQRAGEKSADLPNVTFQAADARSLPFADATFDVVVFDSTLVHVPDADRAVAEAFRVMRPRSPRGDRRRLRHHHGRAR